MLGNFTPGWARFGLIRTGLPKLDQVRHVRKFCARLWHVRQSSVTLYQIVLRKSRLEHVMTV
jgi:hypothetical protein